ncbi:hypothetical protein AAVH_20284 [Aphelenchoides avenae]|nr:hypothetical protein AAVH_20284 [Aphelenchus avenae]
MFRRGAPTPTNRKDALMASAWIGYRAPGQADFLKKHEFRWVDGSPNHFRNWIPSKAAKSEWYFVKPPVEELRRHVAGLGLPGDVGLHSLQ